MAMFNSCVTDYQRVQFVKMASNVLYINYCLAHETTINHLPVLSEVLPIFSVANFVGGCAACYRAAGHERHDVGRRVMKGGESDFIGD